MLGARSCKPPREARRVRVRFRRRRAPPAAVAAEAAKDDRLVLIEGMFDTLLNANGQPDETLFLNDRLHLNQAGYARWTKLLRPQLVK